MIYFDNAATTVPSPTALEKAKQFNNEMFFNPSTLYAGGLSCAREIKAAKESILRNLGTSQHEVVFTSCGSESDNMAIFCAVKRGAFVTGKGEHSAVYKSFLELKNRGATVEFIDLNPDGSIDTDKLYNYVKNNKVGFVSISHVGNETGAINDVNEIARRLKAIDKDVVFHSDGVQAYGKIPFKISPQIDLYSISAHKINALKGVGALIKRKNLNVKPLIFGGGQEGGLRSGTENVFGIKVFEYAGVEKYSCINDNFNKVREIKEVISKSLDLNLFKILSGENSSPYILTISAVGLRGEVLMHAMEDKNLIVGNGSACSSKNRYSRVLEACGYGNDVLDGVIRLSFSSANTVDEAREAAAILNETAQKFKRILN